MRAGEPWGGPTTEPPDRTVFGTDADLASVARTGGLVEFRPEAGSDLARAIGLGGPPRGIALPMDAMELSDGVVAVNAVVAGTSPTRTHWLTPSRPVRVSVDGRVLHDGRATGVVVATGQYVDGLDVIPRGHPGDGRLEVQVYALLHDERAGMRRRLASGSHLPHPRIHTGTGRTVVIEVTAGRWPVVVDGVARGEQRRIEVAVRPASYRILV